MKNITQRRTANTVRRDEDRVVSEVLWMDAARELVCGIEADIRTLAIQDAWLEVLKGAANGEAGCAGWCRETAQTTEKHAPARRSFDFLAGAPAFIEGKKIIRQNLTGPEDAIPSYLLQQCINGIIQAETYFFRERGFADEEAYSRYWDALEAGGCRMYSHPDPADMRWMDYVPPGARTRSLFHRLKSTQIIAAPGEGAGVTGCGATTAATDACGTGHMRSAAANPAPDAVCAAPQPAAEAPLICRGTFTDSYHEILLQLTCDAATGVIRDADITYLRAPGKACFDNRVHTADLIGRSIYSMTSADILEAAGRGEGCYHLVEMLKDIRMTLRQTL